MMCFGFFEKNKDKKDVEPGEFPVLSWTEEEAENSLHKLYKYVAEQCEQSRNWYLVKKRRKKRFGYLLRLLAMTLTALAGIIPILAQGEGNGFFQWLNPSMASVAIAIAALLVAIDKFGDMSSGWVRYMLTAQKLSQIEQKFRFEWEDDKLAWVGKGPTSDQVKEALQKFHETVMEIDEVVHEETRVWAAEFLSSLHEIEKASKISKKQKQVGDGKGKDKKDG